VLSPLVARAGVGVLDAVGVPWEELAVGLASRSIELATGVRSGRARTPLNAEARVARTVREIDRHPDDDLTLGRLSRLAGSSPYHFLRTFERVTGLTPHQYVRRARLRLAATRLLAEQARVLDIALDCGFGDVSNFNRAFRMEFGVSPRALRRLNISHGANGGSPNHREPGRLAANEESVVVIITSASQRTRPRVSTSLSPETTLRRANERSRR
jgi:AraC family transcriptional regulator